MAPEALAQVLRPLSDLVDRQRVPELIVGLGDPDDAAVYRLSEDRALVATTDFFTPIVDDPHTFGGIAAANAMSDVFAMGGRVLFALNIAAFPANLPPELIASVFRGAAEKVQEAGGVIAGGHTIQDKEPKYGLSVIGAVDPRRLLTKRGARPGDLLVLTKPLGTGVLTTALMRDLLTAEQLSPAVESMLRLNDDAAAAAREAGVVAATDVTGFGLLGHASEMLGPHGFRIDLDSLPLLPLAREHGERFVYPGGAHSNRAHFGPQVRFDDGIGEAEQLLCFSPETSGGRLRAAPASAAEEIRARLDCTVIGEVTSAPGLRVTR